MGGIIRVNERFELPYMRFERDHAVRPLMLDFVRQYLMETKAASMRYKLQEYVHLSPLQHHVEFAFQVPSLLKPIRCFVFWKDPRLNSFLNRDSGSGSPLLTSASFRVPRAPSAHPSEASYT